MVATLKGLNYGPKKLTLNSDFGFVERGLPEGKYTITAGGTVFNSYFAEGSVDVDAWPVGEPNREPITVLLERKPQNPGN
jgi:hypothetical protein